MPEVETKIELVIPSPKKLFTPAVTVFIILMIAGYALVSYLPDFTITYFALSTAGIFSGKIWQLVTYPFIDPNTLILIFECFIMVFVGSNIEREYRSGGLVLLWLVVSVTCGIIWVLVCRLIGRDYIGIGSWGCGFGLSAAFGVLFYKRRYIAWFWVMEAQYVSWGLIAIGAIFCIPRAISLLWLSGALVAYLYVKMRLRGFFPVSFRQGTYKPQSFVDIE